LFDVPSEPQVGEATEALPENSADLAAATGESVSAPSSDPKSEFTFGGNVGEAEPSQGGSKKVVLALVAVVLLAAALYIGWTQLHGKVNLPFLGESQPSAAPVASSPSPRPATPSNAPAAPTSTPAAVPVAQSSAQPASAAPAPPASKTADFASTQEDSSASTSGPNAAKLAKSSAMQAAGSAAAKAAQPIIVKGDAPLPTLKKADAPVDPAPSMVGLGTAGSGAPINLVNTSSHTSRPVLQSVNVSQGVSQGVVIKKVQPKYPSNAISRHIEGSVSLTATIGKNGSITAVKVDSGEPMLTQAAIDAVRQWKYKPYLLNGEPVELQTQVTLVFKLPR
jgi:TonB family protein